MLATTAAPFGYFSRHCMQRPRKAAGQAGELRPDPALPPGLESKPSREVRERVADPEAMWALSDQGWKHGAGWELEEAAGWRRPRLPSRRPCTFSSCVWKSKVCVLGRGPGRPCCTALLFRGCRKRATFFAISPNLFSHAPLPNPTGTPSLNPQHSCPLIHSGRCGWGPSGQKESPQVSV